MNSNFHTSENKAHNAAEKELSFTAPPEVIQGTQEIIIAAQIALKKLPKEFEKGLNQVANMFWIQFCLGIFLLIASIGFQFLGFNILTYLFGATGGIVLVSTFITSSPVKLQKNRVDLAQLGIAYFNWFNALLIINQKIAVDSLNGTLTWEEFKDSQSLLLQTTERTLKNMEELCEFSKMKPDISGTKLKDNISTQ